MARGFDKFWNWGQDGRIPAADATPIAISLGSSVTTGESFAAMGLPFFVTDDQIIATAKQLEETIFS